MAKSGELPPTAAVVLAAGSSRRFGAANKLVVDAGGKPLLRRVIEPLLACGLAPVIVVTGHEHGLIEATVAGLPVVLAHNPAHLTGMGSSVARGVASLAAECAGVLITPGDMPNVSRDLVGQLLAAFARTGRNKIVFPVLDDGMQRNPVLWPARYFADLRALSGDRGAKGLIERHGSDTLPVPVACEALLADIDHADDLERWRTPDKF